MMLALRRATSKDAAAFARILGDAAVYPGTMQLPYADEEAWRVRLTEMSAPGRSDLSLVAERESRIVGSAGLHPTGPQLRRRHVMMLGISVLPEAQRQGVGSALMQALCDYADRWAQVLRIELTVFADNATAIRLYQRFGFEIEGRHRAYALRDGAFIDVLSMARLHPRPPQLPGAMAPAGPA
jgi:putative acetyltransferase